MAESSGRTAPSTRTVLVTGARGVVGAHILPRLCDAGFDVLAATRGQAPPTAFPSPSRGDTVSAASAATVPTVSPTNPTVSTATSIAGRGRVSWLTLDLSRVAAAESDAGSSSIGGISCLIHAAALWLLPPLLEKMPALGVKRLVAFSSTSRLTKQASPDAREREVAALLANAENALRSSCERNGIAWTIFRPTLIYDEGRDRNVSDIARLIRRFGVCPIAGDGRGRRQPVHADDLAAACVAALDNRSTFGRAYELPGGETLTYAEMVARVAKAVGRRAWTPHVPLWLLRRGLSLAAHLPGFSHLTPQMADRMDEDLVFDGASAARDFGWAPRPFRYDLDFARAARASRAVEIE